VLTHADRLKLIFKPFPITTYTTSGRWGGTAVADNFFGTRSWADLDKQNRVDPVESPALADADADDLTLLQSGASHVEVADRLSVSEGTVRYRRKKIGWRRPRGSQA
jgi:hypothetical protein